MSLQAPLWRSIALFRFASLIYASVLLAVRPEYYRHWGWAWVVLGVMAAWTAVSTVAYAKPARRSWPLLTTDLLITALAVLSTAILQMPRWVSIGVMPVTATWLAGPALGSRRRDAGRRGRRRGDRRVRRLAQVADLRYVQKHGAGRADHPTAGRGAGRLRLDPVGARRASAAASHRDRGGEPGAGQAGPHDPRLGAAGARDGAATRRGGGWRGRGDRQAGRSAG